jgi:hypothetical protein
MHKKSLIYHLKNKLNKNYRQTPETKSTMKNDLDSMQTVQSKNIDPVNTNIHKCRSHALTSARTNIIKHTTPRNVMIYAGKRKHLTMSTLPR